MKKISVFILFCVPGILGAQEAREQNPWKAPRLELPDAVKNAKVLSHRVVQPSSKSEGRFIVEVIETPVFPNPVPVEAAAKILPGLDVKVPTPKPSPVEFRLFSPTVVVYENGLSQVSWWSADRAGGFQEYKAWVRVDLSSIHACGELSSESRRFLVMARVFHAKQRMGAKDDAPGISSFKLPTDIVLTKGDPANQEILEPRLALLEKYDREGERIESTAAAWKADQEARVAWETAHPDIPQDTIIKFFPVGPPSQAVRK